MKRKNSQQGSAGTPVRSKGWLDSCDHCSNQEDGGHYCLMHSRTMKNMDTLRCSDWTPKPEPKKSNTPEHRTEDRR